MKLIVLSMILLSITGCSSRYRDEYNSYYRSNSHFHFDRIGDKEYRTGFATKVKREK